MLSQVPLTSRRTSFFRRGRRSTKHDRQSVLHITPLSTDRVIDTAGLRSLSTRRTSHHNTVTLHMPTPATNVFYVYKNKCVGHAVADVSLVHDAACRPHRLHAAGGSKRPEPSSTSHSRNMRPMAEFRTTITVPSCYTPFPQTAAYGGHDADSFQYATQARTTHTSTWTYAQ